MQLATRPWITAAAALAGAGFITATPVAPALIEVQTDAVQLTSVFDDISFAQVFSDANTSFTDNILNPFTGAPFPALEQVGLNLATYLADALKDPSTASNIPTEIQDNLTKALNAAVEPFYPTGSESYLLPSLDSTPVTVGFSVDSCTVAFGCTAPLSVSIDLGGHDALLNDLIHGLPISLNLGPVIGTIDFGTVDLLKLLVGSSAESQVLPYLEFSASPLSGVLWGLVGTEFSPWAQLLDDGVHIFDALDSSTPDYATALADLEAVPANVTNAFLEGYGNVGNLLSDLGLSLPGVTPEIDLGGLLSPAGSLFNALGFDLGVSSSNDILGVTWSASAALSDPATTVGPIASMLEMGQAIAQSIGWDDVGNQLANLAGLF